MPDGSCSDEWKSIIDNITNTPHFTCPPERDDLEIVTVLSP